MVKKVSPCTPAVSSVEHAVALHLVLECPCCTTKQRLIDLLKKVKELTANRKLTIQKMKQALEKWFKEGWAVITKDVLQVTRAGRSQSKKRADEATAPSSVVPA